MIYHTTSYSAILLLICTSLLAFQSAQNVGFAFAEEEPVVDEMSAPVTESPDVVETGPKAAEDADVTFLLTRPNTGKPYEFPIGKEVRFLVGFKNKGQKDFQIQNMDTSFRYSLDFSYVLQNFTSNPYNRIISPNQEGTFGYSLYVSEQYAARSYGFTVNLLYADKEGVQYTNTVFNETVTLIELDEGLNSESIFLVLLLSVFVAFIGYSLNKLYLKYVNPIRRSSTKPQKEQEKTTASAEVDYDWLPPTMVANLKKTSTGSKKAPAN